MARIASKLNWTSDPDNAPLPSDFNRIENNNKQAFDELDAEVIRATADVNAEEARAIADVNSQTAASVILTRLKTVDGPGCGLSVDLSVDSNTVDGYHAAPSVGMGGMPIINYYTVDGNITVSSMALGEIVIFKTDSFTPTTRSITVPAGTYYVVLKNTNISMYVSSGGALVAASGIIIRLA